MWSPYEGDTIYGNTSPTFSPLHPLFIQLCGVLPWQHHKVKTDAHAIHLTGSIRYGGKPGHGVLKGYNSGNTVNKILCQETIRTMWAEIPSMSQGGRHPEKDSCQLYLA